MSIAKLSEAATNAWFIDHCGAVSHGTVIAMNRESVALLIGKRLLLLPRGECFADEAVAIGKRLKTLSSEIAARLNQWTELLTRLGPHETMEAS